jgi:hypothetical protein
MNGGLRRLLQSKSRADPGRLVKSFCKSRIDSLASLAMLSGGVRIGTPRSMYVIPQTTSVGWLARSSAEPE